MKLTKSYLKNLILEALGEQKINETFSFSQIKDMDEQQLIQFLVNYSKKLTNNENFSSQNVLSVISATEIPPKTVSMDPRLAKPIKRDPATGRPIPGTAEEEPSNKSSSMEEPSGPSTNPASPMALKKKK